MSLLENDGKLNSKGKSLLKDAVAMWERIENDDLEDIDDYGLI